MLLCLAYSVRVRVRMRAHHQRITPKGQHSNRNNEAYPEVRKTAIPRKSARDWFQNRANVHRRPC